MLLAADAFFAALLVALIVYLEGNPYDAWSSPRPRYRSVRSRRLRAHHLHPKPLRRTMLNLGKYAKLITALVGAAVVIIGRAAGVDSTIYLDVVTVVTALGVYAVPNKA